MKPKAFILFFFILFAKQAAFAQTVDEEILNLIESKDIVSFNHRFQTAKDSIFEPALKLFGEVYVYSSTAKPREAIATIETLLNEYQDSFNMQAIINLIDLLTDNMRDVGEYENSSEWTQHFLDQTAEFNGLDSLERFYFENQTKLSVFGDTMKPEIIRLKEDCAIPLSIKYIGDQPYYTVDVKANGQTHPFVLDTGCGVAATNLIAESVAEKLGVRPLNDSVKMEGIGSGYVKMGILDSVEIGDVIYKNVAFTIAKGDDILSADDFLAANDSVPVYEGIAMDAILGSVFMRAVGEFQIYPKENKMVLPASESKLPPSGSNLVFIYGQPYLQMFHNNKALIIHLDTGGNTSLSDRFYSENKSEVQQFGIEDEGGIGGFGGAGMHKIYILPTFALQLGDVITEMTELRVYTTPTFPHTSHAHGTVATDYIRMFDKVVVNFNKMFMTVE